MSFIQELELRVLNVDRDLITAKITEHGGQLLFSGLQERNVFDVPAKDDHSWLRLRSAPVGTTLTVKETEGEVVKEIEVGVDDYEKTLDILRILGINPRARHQNHRTLFKLPNDTEIAIDTWPILNPFLEIEAPNMEQIISAVALLGLSVSETTTMNIVEIYELAGITGITHMDLLFSDKELEQLK